MYNYIIYICTYSNPAFLNKNPKRNKIALHAFAHYKKLCFPAYLYQNRVNHNMKR